MIRFIRPLLRFPAKSLKQCSCRESQRGNKLHETIDHRSRRAPGVQFVRLVELALQATGNLSIRETARPRASKETRRLHRPRCRPGSRWQSGGDEDFPISDGATVSRSVAAQIRRGVNREPAVAVDADRNQYLGALKFGMIDKLPRLTGTTTRNPFALGTFKHFGGGRRCCAQSPERKHRHSGQSTSVEMRSCRKNLSAGRTSVHVDFHANRHFDDFRSLPNHFSSPSRTGRQNLRTEKRIEPPLK